MPISGGVGYKDILLPILYYLVERHQMETFSALLALCVGNSPVWLTKASDAGLWCFFFNWAWINGCVNIREAGDLRHQHNHYDVSVMNYRIHGENSSSNHWNTSVTSHERWDIPNQQQLNCFWKCLFGLTKTKHQRSELLPFVGQSPVAVGFLSQRSSNEESVSMYVTWNHHVKQQQNNIKEHNDVKLSASTRFAYKYTRETGILLIN